ncbi:hypothetical protein [Haladaptatus sp. DJG-WS-42]|uniref:hypothetical protein n=1 Tax=Haladaptatus sp. DJG-WS-42 TaxID=3120516 RepID=UPI0030D179E9
MGDSSTENHADAPHIILKPDAFHEEDGGLYIDCPACGSSTPLMYLVENGHCSGYVDVEMSESDSDTDPVDGTCQASLSLELVWEE